MTYGKSAVDWQQRVDFYRLREDRLARAHKMLHKWGIGAALIFNWDSGRYLGRPWSHPYGRHLPNHFVLLCRDAGYPYHPIGAIDTEVVKDAPWLKDRLVTEDVLSDGGIINLRTREETSKRWASSAQQIKDLMKQHGVDGLPISVDYASPIVIKALEGVGLEVIDGNAWILEADMVKTEDEIELMKVAATANENGYAHLVKEFRPGMRENDAQAIMAKGIYEAGAEYLEGWVVNSGARAAPRNFNWSDRVVRPGEFLVLEACHVTYCGYKVCYSRSFLVGAQPTPLQKALYDTTVEVHHVVRSHIKPGITNHDLARARPTPAKVLKTLEDVQEFRTTFANHFGGMGIRWNGAPMIRLNEPEIVLEKNMVVAFAYGFSVPGIEGVETENTYRITDDGYELMTKWPLDELIVIGL